MGTTCRFSAGSPCPGWRRLSLGCGSGGSLKAWTHLLKRLHRALFQLLWAQEPPELTRPVGGTMRGSLLLGAKASLLASPLTHNCISWIRAVTHSSGVRATVSCCRERNFEVLWLLPW